MAGLLKTLKVGDTLTIMGPSTVTLNNTSKTGKASLVIEADRAVKILDGRQDRNAARSDRWTCFACGNGSDRGRKPAFCECGAMYCPECNNTLTAHTFPCVLNRRQTNEKTPLPS